MFQEPIATRSVSYKVTFRHSFKLGKDPRELPAGEYAIHRYEEAYSEGEPLSFVPTSVVIVVEEVGKRTSRSVSPADLEHALNLDAAFVVTTPEQER